jgi:sugar lactone lactonase YvrE
MNEVDFMKQRTDILLFLWLAAVAIVLGSPANTFAQISVANSIRTAVGSGMASYYGDGGAATSADLNQPGGVAVDAARNLYIADTKNSVIRKVDAVSGTISTFAGTGQQGISSDGLAASSSPLNAPGGVAVDGYGNLLIADTGNNRVVVVYAGGSTMSSLITAENASVTSPVVGALYTIAGSAVNGYSGDLGLAISSQLNAPVHVAVDSQGGIYIADTGNNRIRVVYASGTAAKSYVTSANSSVTTPVLGYIYTIAGNGTASSTGDGALAGSATLNAPASVSIDLQNNLYIAEKGGNRVRAIYLSSTLLSGLISLEASGATATANYIYTLAGTGTAGSTGDGSLASNATLSQPSGLTVDAANNIYIADSANGVVRYVTASTGQISTYAGSLSLGRGYAGDGGLATKGQMQTPSDVTLDSSNQLYVADGAGGHRIRIVSKATLFPTTAVGATGATQNIFVQFSADTVLSGISVNPGGSTSEYKVGVPSNCSADGATTITSGTVCSIPVTFVPAYPGLRKAPLVLTDVSGNQYGFLLAGLSTGVQAAVLPGTLSTIAGTGSSGYAGDGASAVAAKLWTPFNVAVDASGNVFINDNANHRIRILYQAGTLAAHLITLENPTVTTPVAGYIYTIAGNGTTATASADGSLGTSTALSTNISGMAVDAADNVYFSEQSSCRIRIVNSLNGKLGTVAGVSGNCSSAASNGDYGPAVSAKLYISQAIALDGLGNLYINNGAYQIRKVDLTTGIITTVAGVGTTGNLMDGIPALTAKFTSMMGLYADPYGNIYFGDAASRRIAIIYAGGTSNPASSLILATHSSLTAPVAGYIYTVAGYGTSGYSGDGGIATAAQLGYFYQMAVDAAGNIYFGDKTNNRIRKVDGKTGIIRTIAGTGGSSAVGDGGPSTSAGVYSPYGMDVDASGNLYIADGANSRIREISAAAYPLTFASTTVGSTATSKSLLLSNIGNVGFTPTSIAVTSGFATTGSSTCQASLTLASGDSCSTYVTFTPQVNGTTSGTLTYSDNATSVPAALTGTGTGGITTTTTLTAPSSITYGQLIPVKVTVTASGSPVTTGTVTFSTGSTTLGSAQLDSTGTAQTTLPTLNAGSYQLTATFVQNGVNMASTSTSALAVSQASLTVTANDASIQYGSALPTFTYTASGMVNNDSAASALSGSPVLSTTAIVGSNAGTYPIAITLGNLTSTNYSITLVNGTLTISGGVAQSISFAAIPDTSYGTGAFAVSATATSSLPVTISVLSGPATITGSTVMITGAGTVVLQASQAGNVDYASATLVQRSFTVAQAPLGVVVKDASHTYGSVDPAFTGTITGLVNGDTIGGTLAVNYSSTDTTSSPVGTYPIQATLSGSALASYKVTITPGVLTITQAPLTFTLSSTSRSYGSSNPTFTGVVGGLANGDAVGTTITESIMTSATTASPIGTYAITGSISGTSASQYSVTIVPGTLTVTAATLTASAGSTSRLYGAVNPTFTGSYSGAANGDTFTESYTTTATQTSNAGFYSIIPALSGSNLGNYTVSVSKGTLTIYQANTTLAVSASGSQVNYGSAVVLTATALSSTTGSPSGTVTFYDGSTTLGTRTLSTGVATLTVSSLLLGTHSITASYAGDYNFYASNASATQLTVIAPQYTVTAASSSLSVASSQTITDVFTLTGVGGYSGTVTFSCDNLPVNMTCNFAPNSATLSSSSTVQSVTMTLSTHNNYAQTKTERFGSAIENAGFAVPGLLLVFAIRRKYRKAMMRMLCIVLIVLSLGASVLLTGCSGSSKNVNTAAGSYQILVQANASGGSSSTVQLTVTVN